MGEAREDFEKRNEAVYKEAEYEHEIELPGLAMDEQLDDVFYWQPIEETLYQQSENAFNFSGTLDTQKSEFAAQDKREFVKHFYTFHSLFQDPQKSPKDQFLNLFSSKNMFESQIVGQDDVIESSAYKDAVLISMLDRQFKQENMLQNPGKHDQQDFASMEISNGQRQSVVYFFDKENASPENVKNLQHSALTLDGIQMQFSIVDGKKQNNLPIIKGFLMKKSPHLLQGWQPRYCVLDNKMLRYYLSDKDKNIFGVINFDIVTYKLTHNLDKKGNLLDFT